MSMHEDGCDNTPVSVWVASAGFGLRAVGDPLKPYSATFVRRHPDSVIRPVGGRTPHNRDDPVADPARQWWAAVTADFGRASLRDLAARHPDRPLLVVASAIYLRAMRADLLEARGVLDRPDLLSVLSAGTQELPGLNEHLLPCDARMRQCVGGVLGSLNVRVARRLLCQTRSERPELPELRRLATELLEAQPALIRPSRTSLDDQQVQRYIVRALRRNPGVTHSRLLKQLRADGFACEQKRFKGLYSSAEGE